MTKSNKSFLNISFMLLLFVLTLSVIFKNNDIADVVKQIKIGNTKILFVAMGMMLISLLCESAIIFFMLKNMKEDITFKRCAKYSFIGFFYCAITPSASGGQPAQIVYMRKDGYKISTSSVIIFTLVTVYKFVLIGFVALSFIVNNSFVRENLNNLTVFYIFGLLVNVLFIVLICLLFFKPNIVKWIIGALYKLMMKIKIIKNPDKIITAINKSVEEYIENVDFVKKNMIILLPVLFLTILQRLLMFSISYVVYKFFGLSELSFFDIISLQVILNTSVDVLPVPGGIGASEMAFKIIFGVAYQTSLIVPAMLVTRFVNFYFMLIVSAVISLTAHFLMIRNEYRKEDMS